MSNFLRSRGFMGVWRCLVFCVWLCLIFWAMLWVLNMFCRIPGAASGFRCVFCVVQ
ncbi:hypothetical protein BDV23DRAFT_145296 [Aspergillus alliaceus]|uniref:Uncharacterized protein n=1 Tax=Petromyces alliaceus TaxID=209559 RepID=A0A5N7CN03_PETAA|nr:hypothetical protein BDV23DRAFT_145296 [Aspergillus alliaceus]